MGKHVQTAKSGVTVLCDYCGNPAKLVRGKALYPHRRELWELYIWACSPCNAMVGTHKGSRDHKPLGRLANPELRAWKIKAHAAFDPLWKGDGATMTRKEAYRHLQALLGVERQPHMGSMDIDQCKRVVELLGSPLPAPVAVLL